MVHFSNFKFNYESIDFFLKSSRKFQFKVIISKTSLPDNSFQFFHKFSENIADLILHSIYLPSVEYLNVKSLKSLRNLELQFCKIQSLEIFVSNIANLKSLKNLEMCQCSFEITSILPDDLQMNITSMKLESKNPKVLSLLSAAPNLQTLSVNHLDCSDSRKTFLKYLKNNKLTKSLTALKLGDKIVHINDFQMNHLKLKAFSCYVLYTAQLETYLSSQVNLTYLRLDNIEILNDQLLQTIFRHLLNLQTLELKCSLICVSFIFI